MDLDALEERMAKTVDSVRKELTKIRTGLASPAMLDAILVDYYGAKTPLPQCAAVSVPEPRTLAIKPWDKSLTQAIEKAILQSDLGITPMNDGTYIRLNFPVLTTERRKELAKLVKKIGEEGKVAVRNIRRDENEHLKRANKESGESEDTLKEYLDIVQEATDSTIAQIDEVIAAKEKDVMTV